jgi:hypothetical protein
MRGVGRAVFGSGNASTQAGIDAIMQRQAARTQATQGKDVERARGADQLVKIVDATAERQERERIEKIEAERAKIRSRFEEQQARIQEQGQSRIAGLRGVGLGGTSGGLAGASFGNNRPELAVLDKQRKIAEETLRVDQQIYENQVALSDMLRELLGGTNGN